MNRARQLSMVPSYYIWLGLEMYAVIDIIFRVADFIRSLC
jgi:hypothetical protein